MMTKRVLILITVVVFLGVLGYGLRKYWPVETKNEIGQVTVAEAKDGWKKEVRSGDGTIKLVGSSRELDGGGVEYTFRVVDGAGQEKYVFKREVGAGEAMDIPFNSWSPDNKQFYVWENDDGRINYYVFKADGATYTNEDSYLSLVKFWEKSKNDFAIRTITGWAGDDLLEVKTDRPDGSSGPSFWFVTSSRSFMQLRG